MADSNEPKKETVRITVTPQPDRRRPRRRPGDTVRIHSPARPPGSQTGPIESPGRSAAAAMPAPITPPASPKKETARITVLPDPPAKPAVQMKKTQALIDLPATERPTTTVAPTPQPTPKPPPEKPQLVVDQIPMPLCWALLGVSAAILTLQIWNYLS